jgi:hypothetical protein
VNVALDASLGLKYKPLDVDIAHERACKIHHPRTAYVTVDLQV